MKLDTKKIEIIKSHDMIEKEFGISEADAPKIMGILRDKLYSNKVLAVLREYACNAYDAHVEAGCPEKPIYVELPTQFSNTFAVRDYGPGLSEKDIYGVYVQYGCSTKTDSNDFVGQLGIGSKSAYSYTDTFTVESFHDGKKSSYVCYLDDSGRGKITKISEEDTTETGIRVSLVTRQEDRSAFLSNAASCYSFFNVTPTFNCPINLTEIKPFIEGVADVGAFNNRGIIARMGNIGYNINPNSITRSSKNWQSFLSYVRATPHSSIVLNFNIGELSIAASREDIEYTDKTVDSLFRKVEELMDRLALKVQELVGQEPNEFKARVLFGSIKSNRDENIPGIGLLRIIARGMNEVEYRGKKIAPLGMFASKNDTFKWHRVDYRSYRARNRVEMRPVEYYDYNNSGKPVHINDVYISTILVEYDDSVSACKKRLDKFLTDKGTRNRDIYALTINPGADRKKVFEAIQIPEDAFTKSIDMEKPPANTTPVDSIADRSKHISKIFKLKDNLDNAKKEIRLVKSNYWDQQDVELDSANGYFVLIDRFETIIEGMDTPVDAPVFLSMLNCLGIDRKEVFGVKKDVLDTAIANPNLVNLSTDMKGLLEAKAASVFTPENECAYNLCAQPEFRSLQEICKVAEIKDGKLFESIEEIKRKQALYSQAVKHNPDVYSIYVTNSADKIAENHRKSLEFRKEFLDKLEKEYPGIFILTVFDYHTSVRALQRINKETLKRLFQECQSI